MAEINLSDHFQGFVLRISVFDKSENPVRTTKMTNRTLIILAINQVTDALFTDRKWFWELFVFYRLRPENNYIGNSEGAAKGSVIQKGGVCKRNECKQTSAKADNLNSFQAPYEWVQNAGNREQTQANSEKREQTQNRTITPPFTYPLLRQPKILGLWKMTIPYATNPYLH